jgi:hypothetical protein
VVEQAKTDVCSAVAYSIYSKITNTLDVHVKRIISYFSDNLTRGCERAEQRFLVLVRAASESSEAFCPSSEPSESSTRLVPNPDFYNHAIEEHLEESKLWHSNGDRFPLSKVKYEIHLLV